MSPDRKQARTLSSVLYIHSSTPQHPYSLFLPKNAEREQTMDASTHGTLRLRQVSTSSPPPRPSSIRRSDQFHNF